MKQQSIIGGAMMNGETISRRDSRESAFPYDRALKWNSCRSRWLSFAFVMGLLAFDLRAAPGQLDGLDLNMAGPGGVVVNATAVQRDGKILIGGSFTNVLGVVRYQIARLNADGTLDTSFDLGLGSFSTVYAIALQPDGKIVVGGVNIRAAHHIARFNANGSLDAGFDPNPNATVWSLAVQADGKVVLGGFFTALQPNGAASPTTRNCLARVNTDGTLDTPFDPNPNFQVRCLAVQTDGKILLGGLFTTLQPNGAVSATARNYFARVNGDGTLDTFDPHPDFYVHSVAVQADAKVVFGGDFINIQPAGAPAPTPRRRLARVNGDGSVDTAFDPSPDGRPLSIALLADHTMILGGAFTFFQPNGSPNATFRSRIALLLPDGTIDGAFNPNAGFTVHSITVQADGRVIAGGEFTSVNSTARKGFARLLSYPSDQSLSIVPARFLYELIWHRVGATPDLTRATFENSTDGGATWSAPVIATRSGTTADWSYVLFSVNGSGFWRARGYTSDAQGNGSSSVIEQVLQYGPDSRVFIPGVFNTGVDDARVPLSNGSTDSHYVLQVPSPVIGNPTVFTSAGGFPIPPWIGDNASSAWIGTGNASAPGTYYYRTTFDLTGMNPATATLSGQWSTDDSGSDILINGTSTGASSGGFSSFTPFQISSGFVPGINTLTFVVNNANVGANPSGLRVEVTALAARNLQLLPIVKTTNNVTITWISQPGRTYRVQYKVTLSDPVWTDVPGDVVATSGISSKTFALGNPASNFYRVLLLP